MIRLYSRTVYFAMFAIPCFYGVIAFFVFSTRYSPDPFFVIFLLPIPIWGYIIYHSRKVYYKDGELYIAGLFSKNFNIVKKEMIGSINEYAFPVRRFLSFSRTTGAYKLTYYNENNDVKHVCFT